MSNFPEFQCLCMYRATGRTTGSLGRCGVAAGEGFQLSLQRASPALGALRPSLLLHGGPH